MQLNLSFGGQTLELELPEQQVIAHLCGPAGLADPGASVRHALEHPTNYPALRHFRDDLYACCYRRADALFELADALVAAGALPSPVHLSGEPVHRRGWGGLSAALRYGRLDETGLRALLPCHPLADGQPVYAVDCSVWPRCDAETSLERGFYYPSRHSAGQPIVAGWSYQ